MTGILDGQNSTTLESTSRLLWRLLKNKFTSLGWVASFIAVVLAVFGIAAFFHKWKTGNLLIADQPFALAVLCISMGIVGLAVVSFTVLVDLDREIKRRFFSSLSDSKSRQEDDMKMSRPFSLDTNTKMLWYEGRRNVAFGVDTINQVFRAFADLSRYPGCKGDYFHEVGIAAGRVFAYDFNSTVIERRSAENGEVPNFQQARSLWEKYDDKVGFGDLHLGKLQLTHVGGEGEIHIMNLFTAKSLSGSDDPDERCEWMGGYLEGFLNNALVLGPRNPGSLKVTHTECLKRNDPCCVFLVEERHEDSDGGGYSTNVEDGMQGHDA